MSTKTQFLKAVLGEDGACALLKATERSTALENALVPRTILAWIGLAARSEYEGKLPGIDNSYVAFRKSEDGYSGQIGIGEDTYDFQEQSVYHLAASVAVSMGVDHERVPSSLKDSDVARLGKSIDLLVKARVVTEQFAKVEPPGQTAKPSEASEPIPPDAPSMKQDAQPKPAKPKSKLPKLPKTPASVQLPKLKLSEAQLQKKCPDCDGSHIKNGQFVGCMCWRDLAKNTTLSKNPDGTFTMTFGRNWDRDAFETFISDMRIQ